MEKKRKKTINNKRAIIACVGIIAVIYILYVTVSLIFKNTDTIFVEQGTIHREETVVGYIIREETVIKSKEYKNGIIQIAEEGERVAKDDAIFQYFNNDTDELIKSIADVNIKIQETIKEEKINSTSDIKLIETQIEEKLKNLRKIKNIQEIAEYSNTIEKLFEKKIEELEKSTTSSEELKNLIKERKGYKQQITNQTQYIEAPTSGIVSYKIDGLESDLTTQNFEKLEKRYLESLNLKTGQIIATSSEAGKVIDNFKYYIAVPMNSKEAMSAKVGEKVEIRLSTNDEIKSEIIHIKDETDGRILFFEVDRLTENLINYRKISFDVIWWSDSGLKISNKAIAKDENNLSYIVRTKSGYVTKLLVKVVSSNENYSIVTSYNTEELTDLGYSQEEISSYKRIKLYDEVILNPSLKEIK